MRRWLLACAKVRQLMRGHGHRYGRAAAAWRAAALRGAAGRGGGSVRATRRSHFGGWIMEYHPPPRIDQTRSPSIDPARPMLQCINCGRPSPSRSSDRPPPPCFLSPHASRLATSSRGTEGKLRPAPLACGAGGRQELVTAASKVKQPTSLTNIRPCLLGSAVESMPRRRGAGRGAASGGRMRGRGLTEGFQLRPAS